MFPDKIVKGFVFFFWPLQIFRQEIFCRLRRSSGRSVRVIKKRGQDRGLFPVSPGRALR